MVGVAVMVLFSQVPQWQLHQWQLRCVIDGISIPLVTFGDILSMLSVSICVIGSSRLPHLRSELSFRRASSNCYNPMLARVCDERVCDERLDRGTSHGEHLNGLGTRHENLRGCNPWLRHPRPTLNPPTIAPRSDEVGSVVGLEVGSVLGPMLG